MLHLMQEVRGSGLTLNINKAPMIWSFTENIYKVY